MTVNSYLVRRASDAVLSDNENSSINTSIATVQSRLNSHFGADVSQHFRFGSSTRGTILPRKMDEHSDIDYMVVFAEEGYTPQTYLNRLRSFVDRYYPSSDIKQCSPTIVLELNHIKFDLVPALKDWTGYKIPNGTSAWQNTNPNDFNQSLETANKTCGYMMKPTIRLIKYWNARAGYVFDSFALEKWMIESYYARAQQKDYLFAAFDRLSPYSMTEQWRKDRVQRAKDIVAEVRRLEDNNMPVTAEAEVKKLIPDA